MPASPKLGRIGAVEPLEWDMDGEPGRGVGTGLPVLKDDKVDMRLSHLGGVFSEPLNSNAKGPRPVEGRPDSFNCESSAIPFSEPSLSFVSGVEPSVLMPPLKLLDEVNGRPAELRFGSLDVGAEAGWGCGDGVVGMVDRGGRSFKVALDVVFLLFDMGLAAIECCGWPKANPTAATPTVPVAQSCSREIC